MNQDETKVFFAILRSAINGNKLNDEELKCFSNDKLPKLIEVASKHDVQHLLVFGLKQNNLISSENAELERHIYNAVCRYEILQYEYEIICSVLENSKIPFLPLKGAVIRSYYKEPWMRTSCDIDILVQKEQIDIAKSTLVEKCGYVYHGKGGHDLSFFSKSGVHVELHYDLVEEGRANKASKILQNVFDNAILSKEHNYRYEMTDEAFYFYHVAHMAKHFEDGGCGVRPFIDLWILDGLQTANKEKRDLMLASSNLLKFANSVRKLSRVWFMSEPHDLITKQMENYVLAGGVYGNSANLIMVHQQKKGGRIRYVLSKIFIPYNVIKFQYPILQKHPILTPVMQVRRWFRIIFGGHLKRVVKELKYNKNISSEEANGIKSFLENIGL